MELTREWIDYPAPDGEPVRGWLARPMAAEERLPGIVVIQEVWGVDAHIRDVTERLAAAGFVALAPDLYSHGGTPPELEQERLEEAKAFLDQLPAAAWTNDAEREAALDAQPDDLARRLRETMAAGMPRDRDWERLVGVLSAGVETVRAHEACDGEVASIGFCLGGGLSIRLAAAGAGLAAAVVFYGASPPAEMVSAIACPVLGVYGGLDHRITDAVPAFAEAMSDAGRILETAIYPHAPHAFFNDTRGSYRAGPARDAWARTLSFLAAHVSHVTAQPAV